MDCSDASTLNLQDKFKSSLNSGRTIYKLDEDDATKFLKLLCEERGISLSIFRIGNNVLYLEDNENRRHVSESLSETTLFPIEKIKEINSLLKTKKQVIFYGPPGTGKTFFAKKFAEFFTKNIQNIEIVQFHPSYSYEDFIEEIKLFVHLMNYQLTYWKTK